jgi:hypothetical protein
VKPIVAAALVASAALCSVAPARADGPIVQVHQGKPPAPYMQRMLAAISEQLERPDTATIYRHVWAKVGPEGIAACGQVREKDAVGETKTEPFLAMAVTYKVHIEALVGDDYTSDAAVMCQRLSGPQP